ncbi:MAG: hypothetical protein DRI97_00700 [Bacteroidetes bacterium]|nr:MAG: hypothetical protein DRI97_00700 [Bacteroidota bacterium]RLD82775.1 MAG: hypothetical protein DRJ15_00600 [Bacteroidota bacterium]
MKKVFLLALFLFSSSLYAQETVTLFITDGNDDAYQLYRHPTWENPTGEMFVDAEKLFVGYSFPVGEMGISYHIGLRYQSVPIPQGSTIESTYIQFYSFEANDDTTGIIIYCEKNPDPLPFTGVEYNISDRETTNHDEFWVASEWQPFIPGPNQLTHNIRDIVQEVVDLETWVKNNPIVFLVKGTNPAFGEDYPKAACSWEYGGEFYAPVLTITYTAPASVEEEDLAKALSIFPNPVTDKFTLSFIDLKQGKYEISLYDLHGRIIHEINTGNLTYGNHQFDFSAAALNMQTGIYLIRVHCSQGDISRKIVVR